MIQLANTVDQCAEFEESYEAMCRKYPREYIVFEVTARDDLGQPSRGKVHLHTPDEEEAFAVAQRLRPRSVALFYNLPAEERENLSYLL